MKMIQYDEYLFGTVDTDDEHQDISSYSAEYTSMHSSSLFY